MKTQPRFENVGRNSERGAIAIVVAALWLTLFGLAAFAVDIGYQYTTKNGVQAAADAAIRAGMPMFGTTSTAQSAARANAIAMATANGYTAGPNTTVDVTFPASDQMKVAIGVTQPSFFLKIFGISTRQLSAASIGKVRSLGTAALHANGGCGSAGLVITGNNPFVINGNVESNGPLQYSAGPSVDTTNGYVESSCAGQPAPLAPQNIVTGTVASVGPTFPDPFGGTTFAGFPPCTLGDLVTPLAFIPNSYWTGPSPQTLTSGVYCSGGDLNVSTPDPSLIINAPNVTFLATGKITIGANNGGILSAFPGSPNGIFAFTTSNVGCGAGQDINVGQNNFVINGSMYAPNGCIREGGFNMTYNGAMVANEIFLGLSTGAPWTITAPGSGGGGPSWSMYQ